MPRSVHADITAVKLGKLFRQLPDAPIVILKQKSFVETELEKDSATKVC
jgi:hypothetical protein